jgi:hypothetical protein
LMACTISIGFYLFIFEENQLITTMNPSEETYRGLQKEHSKTLVCPCSKYSQEYRTLVNVTFVYHQVCSSDLVSTRWIDYLRLFDPGNVSNETENDYSRDFRSYGLIYFQLLSSFCTVARTNIEYAQNTFASTAFVNSHVLSPEIYMERIQSQAETLIRTTVSKFLQMLKWVDINNRVNSFLTGTNINFQVSVVDDQVLVLDTRYTTADSITHDHISLTGSCSCGMNAIECHIALLLYHNQSEPSAFSEKFEEISVGCIPLDGFIPSKINWWYESHFTESIRKTYALVIPFHSSPDIRPLDTSSESRFRYKTMADLLAAMFVEAMCTHGCVTPLHLAVYSSPAIYV